MKQVRKLLLILGIILVSYSVKGQAPDWSVNPSDYANSCQVMSVVILGPDEVISGILGAFVGETCRGVESTPAVFPPTGKTIFTVMCYSNSASGETLTFKYYNPGNGTIYDIIETQDFIADEVFGTAAVPLNYHTVNTAPVVGDIGDQTIIEGASFTSISLDDFVTDTEDPDANISWQYSGTTDLTVSITDRVATVNVPDADWNGSETITFIATDTGGLTDSDQATFTVTAVNDTPVLGSIGNRSVCQLALLTFTATASDVDVPTVFSYSLISPPAGAAINSSTGIFTWTSAIGQSGDFTFTVRVTDDGTPALYDEEEITVTVSPLPGAAGTITGTASVCQGATGVTYSVPAITNTTSYTWIYGGAGATINGSSNAVTISFDATATSGNLTVYGVNACGNGTISANYPVTVNANLPVSVSISAVPSGAVCTGTSVTYTATPTNGGTTPSYQWQVNGANVGTSLTTYSYTPVNGDVVRCILTSNAPCATGSPATSNSITMAVNANLPVSVSISAVPSGAVCTGTSVTYTATPTNGGTTPSYQWQVNGSNVGTSLTTYSYTPVNGDVVRCILTSNAPCATGSPATSNSITMAVNANLPVSVSISAVPSGAVCTGTSVTYTATPTNGGTTPSYQWQVNGSNVGTSLTTYSYTPVNGDVVRCILTSNAPCATGSPATSNSITMAVNANLPVSVSISAVPSGAVCTGTSVTYTATPTNGGTTPSYQWQVNGSNVGTSLTTYSYTPVNGDVVRCILTSNAPCATGSPATSNSITMAVNANLPVSVSISAVPSGAVCTGTSVTYTATPTNGGTTPSYQWQVNGSNVGTSLTTYSYTPVNGDVVRCILTSNAPCATGSPATSNSITMAVNASLPVSVRHIGSSLSGRFVQEQV